MNNTDDSISEGFTLITRRKITEDTTNNLNTKYTCTWF